MLIEIFEFAPRPGQEEAYFAHAEAMRAAVAEVEGFLGVERFESVTAPGHFVSISRWQDEAAITRWRNHPAHRAAQKAGREGIFSDYRITVAEILRDYTATDREEAPEDSRRFHGV